MNKILPILTDSKRLKFYLWTGFAFWGLYSIAESVAYPETILSRTLNSIFLIGYTTVLHYILFEFTLPLLHPKSKRFFWGLLLLLLLLLLYSFGLYAWRYFLIQLHIYISYVTTSSHLQGVAIHSQFSLTTLLFFGVAKHIYNYVTLKTMSKQLQIEKQAAELNYLKSQTNPHFLFNTLNNIYSLARDKSDLAPESILRLSKILRFMLYEAGDTYTTVAQEVRILSDYIALEKLRYDDSLQVNFDCTMEDGKQELPPLLLMPLVENAFKHGISETRATPFIAIRLSVDEKRLRFVVENSAEASPEVQEVKEHIGLSNLRRQLELLYRDFHLSVNHDRGVFTAMLKINLSSHV